MHLPDQLTLQTERLELLGLTPWHIHELFAAYSKEEIMSYLGITSEADYNHYLEMHEMGMETHRYSLYIFILVEKETGRPIGECGFHTWNNKHNKADLFYLLRHDADKQKGYMKEALLPIINFGFRHMHLHRIAAYVADWNTPSVKLLKHYGFTLEGTMREDYLYQGNFEASDCYSLLQHEWKLENFNKRKP